MNTERMRRKIILTLPYLIICLLATNIGEAIRLTAGGNLSERILSFVESLGYAFENPTPSFRLLDILIGLGCGIILRIIVYIRSLNSKNYRHNVEHGSARWGEIKEIEPFIDPVFENNVILTRTERLMMGNRPKNPACARNKNVLIVGGSGSGKTRFWIKPNLLQLHSSYVLTDPKGTTLPEVGNAFVKANYRIKIFNTINFQKSMHYNPFVYIKNEKDILKLTTTLMANTKGEGNNGDPFWDKAETLLYCALIGYIHYEAPMEEQNFATLIEFINSMEVREDDEDFQNSVDLLFEELERRKPDHFAVRQYKKFKLAAGKTQKNDVIAYQIRQSFKPGEITPEEANRLGNELAMRFTKGKFAFIVATHTDRKHIHNHIVFNSTSLEGDRKFRNFWFSGLALQRISDLVCLENGLSIIEPKPYGERGRDVKFQKQEKIRDHICNDIDQLLQNRPGNFEDFLFQLQRSGYEIKRGKHIALRGKNQKRFVRLTSLPDGYKEEDLRTYFTEIKEWNFRERSKGRYECSKKSSFNLIIDIQKKMQDKGPGYKRWATVYNLKQMSKTLLFLRDHDLQSVEQLDEMISKNIEKRDQLLASIQEKEKKLKKITALKTHIINYSKTRIVYEAYRKSGYSKKYLEEHFEEVAIHKAAKVAFDEYEVRRIPSVKELNAQYLEILDVKKKEYVEYRKIKTEIPEYLIAKKNIASLYDAEKRYEANINDRKLER